jgi:hypothetical protein
MNSESTFEDRLHDLIEDGPTDAPAQVLDTVLAAVPSIPQRRAAWRVPWRTLPMIGLARTLAGIVLAVGLGSAALIFLVSRTTPGDIGGPPSPSPAVVVSPTPSESPVASPTASPEATASPTPSATPSPTPRPTPEPTAVPTLGPCAASHLAARITLWTGGAGSRFADTELTNIGSSSCAIRALSRPQLVDGKGTILIDGAPPAGSSFLTIAPGARLKTEVAASNYCGSTPTPPLTIAFVLSNGGRIVAAPASTDDGAPPCNGPGQPGQIDMHPWAP